MMSPWMTGLCVMGEGLSVLLWHSVNVKSSCWLLLLLNLSRINYSISAVFTFAADCDDRTKHNELICEFLIIWASFLEKFRWRCMLAAAKWCTFLYSFMSCFLIRGRPEDWIPEVVQTTSVVLDSGWSGILCCSVEHDRWLAEGAVQKDKGRGMHS